MIRIEEPQLFILALVALAILATWGDTWLKNRAHTQTFPMYRHVKSGADYVVLYDGFLEATGARCVIYTSVASVEAPKPWAREYNEFHDGRFQFIGNLTLINGKVRS